MSIRDDLNVASNNILADDFRKSRLGELLTLLIDAAAYTQTAVVPAADVATLAAVPTGLFQVEATAAAVTGVKTLRIGRISGEDAIIPATGECVWQPGTATILFAAGDAVTAVSALYSTATNKASCLAGSMETDGGAA